MGLPHMESLHPLTVTAQARSSFVSSTAGCSMTYFFTNLQPKRKRVSLEIFDSICSNDFAKFNFVSAWSPRQTAMPSESVLSRDVRSRRYERFFCTDSP